MPGKPSFVYKKGDQPWVQFWRSKMKAPVIGEVQVTWQTLSNIDVQKGRFLASLLMYIRVSFSDLGIDKVDRRLLPEGEAYIRKSRDDPEEAIGDWSPWLDFYGVAEVKSRKEWTRMEEAELDFCNRDSQRVQHAI